MSQRPIDESMLQNLLKKPKEKATIPRRSTTPDYDDRTVTGWFKLPTFEGECSYGEKECLSPDGIFRTVCDVKGKVMCRWCFIGKDK